MSVSPNPQAQLEEYLRQMTESMEAMRLESEALRLRVQELEAQTTATPPASLAPPPEPTPTPYEATIVALLERLSQASNRPRSPDRPTKSVIHPDIEQFTGDPEDLDRFKAQLYVKLSLNADRYTTEEAKVGYAFGRLKGAPAKAMEGYWSKGTTTIRSLDEFLANLERLYGDPDKAKHAAYDWMLLRQKNSRFSTFLAEFERLANIAGITDDDRLLQQLSLSINNELRDRLVGITVLSSTPETYETYRDKCLRIESAIASANTLSTLSRTTNHPHSRTSPKTVTYTPPARYATPRPSSNNSPATGSNTIPIGERTTTQGGNLMDMSRQRGPLTPQEKKHRMDNGLCLYCGEPGHHAKDCHHKGHRLHEMEGPSQEPQSGKELS